MRRVLVGLAIFAVACTNGPVSPSPISPSPVIPAGASTASVKIVEFTVTQVGTGSQRMYAPEMQLAETSGRSAATLVDVSFELRGGGRSGSLPGDRRVPPGGTLRLWNPTSYGYQLELSVAIDGVEVFFKDDEGRPGSVRQALAQ